LGPVLALLLEAAKALSGSGEGDRACRLVAAAWAALRGPRPDLAVRATAALHGLVRTQYLTGLVGLGVAIDYSLLFVTRWREERAKGKDNEAAVRATMESAGRAIAFSGVTVAVGLVALVVLPVVFLRSIGIGGILIPLVSVLASLTLLPVLLIGEITTLCRRGIARESFAPEVMR